MCSQSTLHRCGSVPDSAETERTLTLSDAKLSNAQPHRRLRFHHHHLIHQRDRAITVATDGIPDIIPPKRINPLQTPLRHQRFKHRQHE